LGWEKRWGFVTLIGVLVSTAEKEVWKHMRIGALLSTAKKEMRKHATDRSVLLHGRKRGVM